MLLHSRHFRMPAIKYRRSHLIKKHFPGFHVRLVVISSCFICVITRQHTGILKMVHRQNWQWLPPNLLLSSAAMFHEVSASPVLAHSVVALSCPWMIQSVISLTTASKIASIMNDFYAKWFTVRATRKISNHVSNSSSALYVENLHINLLLSLKLTLKKKHGAQQPIIYCSTNWTTYSNLAKWLSGLIGKKLNFGVSSIYELTCSVIRLLLPLTTS